MATQLHVRVSQNPYLAVGHDRLQAVVSVTAQAADDADAGGPLALGIILDTSESMGEQGGERIYHARRAVQQLIRLLDPAASFFVIAGADQAELVAPLGPASPEAKARAHAAVEALRPRGSTAISHWLEAARREFEGAPRHRRHALLLTDGKNRQHNRRLEQVLAACVGKFQCDVRGVGLDWDPEQMRAVAARLLGTLDIIADPAGLEADFRSMLEATLTKTLGEVVFQMWTPLNTEVEFCRQVAPAIQDVVAAADGAPGDAQQRLYPLGPWGPETRDYHLGLRVKPGHVGQKMLAARVSAVLPDQPEAPAAEAQILAVWTDDEAQAAVIDPQVAHYTGQSELAAAIQEGLEARRQGQPEEAAVRLGRAVQLASRSDNAAIARLLDRVVDVIDADQGTVRLKRDIEEVDALTLDTRSTRTKRLT